MARRRAPQPIKPLYYTALPWKVTGGVPTQQWIDSGVRVGTISSCVVSISYDKENEMLYVEFLGYKQAPNPTYIYYHVPENVARQMYHSSSMGVFVHRRLTPYFTYQEAV